MSFEKSGLYTLSYRLALDVESICLAFPKREEFLLAQQLRKAARSIAANYAEGYVRQELLPMDFRRFLIYSQGSCDETKHWIRLGADMNLIEAPTAQGLLDTCKRLTCMILPLARRRF